MRVKMSIRNKLIVLLLLITIVPFGTSIVVTYLYTKESLKDQFVQENVNLLYQGKVNLEEYIDELKNLTMPFYNNIDFMNYLRYSYLNEDYMTKGTVNDVIQTILYSEENIKKVNIALVDGNRNISVSKRTIVLYSSIPDNLNRKYYQKAKNSPYNIYIEPMDSQGVNSRDVFTFHRTIIDVPSDRILGFISLDITPDKILGISRKLFDEDREEFFIFSPGGETIYQSEEISLKEDWVSTLLNTESPSGTIEIDSDSFKGLMIYEKVADSSGGWILAKRIPYITVFESALGVAKINIVFGIIGLILVILATLFVSFKITSPIRILLQNIKQVEKGNMNVDFDSLGNDEIGVLGDRFKEMVGKINRLINREYKLEIENKTNQLKVLQSQVNPHFLYNALQSIGTLALKNNVPQVYTLVTHLSKIMRYSMNMNEDMVPLMKELDYTKAFLLLQKERFGDQFDYTLKFDEETLYIPVPKMILQPVIENYFKHGFESNDESLGNLTIVGKKQQEHLLITIKDNGKGISQDRLNEINETFQMDNSSAPGDLNIGLKNIFLRLKLYYGESANFKLENNQDTGICVTISLPLMGGEEAESDHN
ncbi:two-component system sensor histidine kinase YesM [Metabacillus crassostreae]|uniref:sensor histidine kinase n=1 Tax=Metabacillus crassostreae TaxID=929098 RepID=UPI00195D940F|nr:sensor histidine kinase [Metabacillus crassostreae]MBM7604359.1 two-component system sensor histidine kinase YesM [Metabacillus crassostreae]